MLTLMVDLYADEAENTGKIPSRKGKPKPLLEWRLSELLKVAKAAEWLPSGLEEHEDWNTRKAKVGDYAEAVRQLRNLAHPAAYREDHYRGRVTARYLRRQFEIMSLCKDRLVHHVHKSLRKHMEAEAEAED